MGWLSSLLGRDALTEARERAGAAEASLEFLTESVMDAAAGQIREGIASLELALEDEGWERLTTLGQQSFSREGLRKAATVARVMAIANPWIKRGLALRCAYVWGQGVQISARANGKDGGQDVNAVVQAFLDDDGNKRALSGDQAHAELERALGTDGNVFLACFTNPRTGFVQVRSVPFDDVVDIISNPDDADDPWLYKRVWTERQVISHRGTITTQLVKRTAYYPAITWRPQSRPATFDGHDILWDAPILHVDVNGLDGWPFGIGDAYAALPWARAYRDFLGDWAVLMKSLSQYAWRLTSKGSKAQEMRAKLARRSATPAPAGNPNTVGATAVTPADVALEAIPKSGATMDSESGRPLAAAVAAALGVPVTILLGDPGTTGARAVAETLDDPTRLEMEQRQALWRDALTLLLRYVIIAAVRAPQGPLRGTVARDPNTGRETMVLAQDTDATVEVVFPSLKKVDQKALIESIVSADTTRKIPPLEIAKLLLRALGVQDIDEIIDELTDDEGRWLDPYGDTSSAGQAAIDAFRRGQDPASVAGMNAGTQDQQDPQDPPPES